MLILYQYSRPDLGPSWTNHTTDSVWAFGIPIIANNEAEHVHDVDFPCSWISMIGWGYPKSMNKTASFQKEAMLAQVAL